MVNTDEDKIFLSIVCPLYNEEANLKNLIGSIHKGLAGIGKNYQIILVDDGSTDTTFHEANQFAEHDRSLKIISYYPNQGRGKALRKGFAEAEGDIIVSIDADLSYSVEHIVRIVDTFNEEKSTDVVIGSPSLLTLVNPASNHQG